MDENDLDLLVDFHVDGLRQGPGSAEATRRALGFLPPEGRRNRRTADIGCGTGAAALVLAEELGTTVTAVDLFRPFLDRLEFRAAEIGLAGRIRTVEASMDALPFADESFDLIWSEGAVYVMGFAEGVRAWRRFLPIGGYLVVSELSWLTDRRPADLDAHWTSEYPEIDTVSGKIRILEAAGYAPEGHFILPPEDWENFYYRPMEARFQGFLERHGYSEAARRLVEGERREMDLFERNREYYGYVFYIARKIDL